ncbi:MAG: SIS domain-containing protein [Desulfovibrio sp.]|nr:SIS domain-containing protein [Desulfovibrio sp.]
MKDTAAEIIANHVHTGTKLHEVFFQSQGDVLQKMALRFARCLAQGGKILLCGNGGDAACAQYMATAFVHQCHLNRPALPALALASNIVSLTAIGNDQGFSQIFARQVEALGNQGDILFGISAQKNCVNVQMALITAQRRGLVTASLACEGADVSSCCDMAIQAPDADVLLVRELHLVAGHILCRLTDYYLFVNVTAL